MSLSGQPLDYTSTGDGRAILALHGGMGGIDQSQLLVRALLGEARGFRVIAVSRPGYPDTPLEAGRTPEQQADLYAQLLGQLGIESVVVTAVSAGGVSALQFAIRHPEKCRALILVSCCTGRLETPPEIQSRLRVMSMLTRVPGIAALMRWKVARSSEETARRSVADPEIRARTVGHPEAGSMLLALQLSVFDRLRRRLPGTLNDIALLAELDRIPFEQISAPALVIHGTGDRVVPFAHAQEAADGIPSAELFAIEGGEHVAMFTHLDEVRARTAGFLEALK
ncbi:MAG: alpha/beta hydrolase [Pseudorhodoplanes sp.]